MKCKHCDGTGTSNWCVNGCFKPCDYCNGTGEVYDKCSATGFFCEMRMGDSCTLGSPCPHQKPLTNEEWFCSLPTKEKAKEMCVIMADMAEANDGVWDEEMIEEWLKEGHKE